jgi:hypothetical protein
MFWGGAFRSAARYFCGGAGVNTSRLRPGYGFALGLGAFFTSFLPLSLFPMRASMTQNSPTGKDPGSRLVINFFIASQICGRVEFA